MVGVNISQSEYMNTQYDNMAIALSDGKVATQAFERLQADEVFNIVNPQTKKEVLTLF